MPRFSTVASCTPQFIMLVLFLVSFSFVNKRKKRLLANQQYRIASYIGD
jgi:hypothetical protein